MTISFASFGIGPWARLYAAMACTWVRPGKTCRRTGRGWMACSTFSTLFDRRRTGDPLLQDGEAAFDVGELMGAAERLDDGGEVAGLVEGDGTRRGGRQDRAHGRHGIGGGGHGRKFKPFDRAAPGDRPGTCEDHA